MFNKSGSRDTKRAKKCNDSPRGYQKENIKLIDILEDGTNGVADDVQAGASNNV